MSLQRMLLASVALFALALPATALADPVLIQGNISVPCSGGGGTQLDGCQPQASLAVYLLDSTDADTSTSSVTEAPVASATSDPWGYYEMTAPNSEALQTAAAENDGVVTFEVVGSAAGYFYSEDFTRSYVNGQWLDDGATPDPVDLVSDTPLTQPKQVPPNYVQGQSGTTADNGYPTYYVASCTRYSFPVSSERRFTTIGELHNASDVTSHFTYGYKADSYISTAYSLDGTAWSLKGSVHIGNESGNGTQGSVSITAPTDNWAHLLQSEFIYTKYHRELWCGDPFAVKVYDDYVERPVKWVGSLTTGADVSSFDHHCLDTYNANRALFGPNTTFSRATNRYHNFESAASLSLAAGIDVRARSGMSQYVSFSWNFGSGTTHYLCGNNDVPTRADRVFAGA